ncbi:hypothetical protein [Natrinema sp. DC36]|uniref:hypothetical protein n=1 Tax=Natrinema sp. DC36 TaxID=2878680 RepID=UPI001CF0BF11|nr:hypothetical protein [Natrinema sp. DC36]
MNTVEKHETDETCNVCGRDNVVNEYGRRSCNNLSTCPAAKNSADISWNSTDEEIEEWKEEQINDSVDNMDTGTINGVDDLEKDDVVTIDHDEIQGLWDVSDTDEIDIGFSQIYVATIVKAGRPRALVGPCTNGDGNTIEVRNIDTDEVLFNISPDDIEHP